MGCRCSKSSKADADELLVSPPPAALGFKPHGVTRALKNRGSQSKIPSLGRVLGFRAVATNLRQRRSVQFRPPRWREPTHQLCKKPLAARYRARAAWTDSTQLDFRGGKSDEGKIKLGAPPAWGRSDAAEQTNLSLHADLPLRSSPHVLGFKVEFVQLLRRRKKRKQTSACRRLTAAIFRGCHP